MKHLSAIAVAATVSALALATPTSAQDHQWGNYHWANDGTGVTLDVYYNFANNVWKTHHDKSLVDWQASSSPLKLMDKGKAGGSSRKCDPISGAIVVCSDTYGQRGWLGIANIWANGDHITQGTSRLNDTYYNLSQFNYAAHRQFVACQEIGHDFGLDHQDEGFSAPNLGTCMDYTNKPEGGGDYGLDNTEPNAADYAMLNADSMYGDGHNDGGTEPPTEPPCRGGPKKCGNGAFVFRDVGAPHPSEGQVDPSQWGMAVGRDREGRPNKFVLDLGNGQKKLTHVTWVPGFRPQPHHFHD